uniref:Uncharacterized protein n=1 Tax=Tanacetum cinerariifolium TaxID=118510 RepID=A0A6L2J4C5_TANCI|nr:hypothetical protein [Tanacetum cinerariifolium]
MGRKHGQAPSFSSRPADQPIDVGSPSVDHLTIVVDDDQVESSSFSKDKDVSGFELAVVAKGCSRKSVVIATLAILNNLIGQKERDKYSKGLD